VFHLISDLQSMGVKVLATSLQTGSSPDKISLTEPVAIIMGSEEKGLHQKVLDIVDDTLFIPGAGLFDSLNVSVATGIFLYEVCRQRAIHVTGEG
jgi:23S rRNA (guanosine2251-2'-O)-methyltransferase